MKCDLKDLCAFIDRAKDTCAREEYDLTFAALQSAASEITWLCFMIGFERSSAVHEKLAAENPKCPF